MSELSKVSFRLNIFKCAEFAIKLKEENVNKQIFLHAVSQAYLDDDEHFLKWWHKYLESRKTPKIRLKRKIKLINEGKELEKDFALNEEEIENIFDILENFED